MISQFMGLSPKLGSVLMAQSLLGILSLSLSLSLSLPLPSPLSLSLSRKSNEIWIKKYSMTRKKYLRSSSEKNFQEGSEIRTCEEKLTELGWISLGERILLSNLILFTSILWRAYDEMKPNSIVTGLSVLSICQYVITILYCWTVGVAQNWGRCPGFGARKMGC